MERRWTILAQMLIIMLAILAFFLFYSIQSQEESAFSAGAKPIVTTGLVELLITVILCVSVSLWVTLTDKKAKEWQRILLFAGLVFAAMFFFMNALGVGVGLESSSPGWRQANPTAVENLNVTWNYLFAITVILALAAIPVFIVILWPSNKIENLRSCRLGNLIFGF